MQQTGSTLRIALSDALAAIIGNTANLNKEIKKRE